MVGSQNFLLIRDKIKKKLMEKEKEKASFANSVIIPNSSRSEGLALLWKRDITVKFRAILENMLMQLSLIKLRLQVAYH